MANNAYVIRIEIVAPETNVPAQANKAVEGLDRMKKKVVETSTETKGSFKDLAGAFTGLVVAGRMKDALTGFIGPAIALEDATKRLEVATGASAAALGKMVAKAKEAAEATTFSPTEAIDGMITLSTALRDTEAAAAAITPALALATASAGRLGLADATKLAADALKNFNIPAENAAGAIDKIVATSRAVRVPLNEFRDVFGKLGVSASLGGQSFESMLSTFALARSLLHSSKIAASELARGIVELSDPKKLMPLEALGVDVVDASGKMRDLRTILGEVVDRGINPLVFASELGTAATMALTAVTNKLKFGIADANGEIVTGTAALEALAAAQSNAGGVTDQIAASAMKTFSAQMDRLSESAMGIVAILGTPLIGTLRATVGAVANVVSGLRQWADSGSFAARVGIALFTVVGRIVFVIGPLFAGFLAVSAAIRIYNAAIASAAQASGLFATALGVLRFALFNVLPVIGIAMVAYELYNTLSDKAGATTDDLNASLGKLPDTLGKVTGMAEETGNEIIGLKDKFKSFMDFINDVTKAGIAIFTDKDFDTLDKAKTALNDIGKTSGMDPTALAATTERLDNLSVTFDKLKRGVPGASEEMKTLGIAVLDTLTALRIHMPEKTGLIEALEKTSELINKTTKPEQIEALERYAGFFTAGKPGLEALKTGSLEELTTPEERVARAKWAAAAAEPSEFKAGLPDILTMGPRLAPHTPSGLSDLFGAPSPLPNPFGAPPPLSNPFGAPPPMNITVVVDGVPTTVTDAAIRRSAAGIHPAGGGFGILVEPD